MIWLSWVFANWRIIGVILAVVGTFGAGWVSGSKNVQHNWDAEKLVLAEEKLKAIAANQKLITELEIKKNENITLIGYINTDVRAVVVRVPARCRPNTTTGGSAPVTSTGIVPVAPQEVAGDTGSGLEQAAFNSFQAREVAAALEADILVENCRVVLDWAKSAK